MAGDWIPMRVDLADDPAVISIAAAIGVDEFAVVGRLHRLWSWANRHLTTGDAPSVTESWVDRYVATPGFAAAMLAAGWLRLRSGHIEFPNFDRWNSQSAKRRIEKALQKRVERERQVSPKSGDTNGDKPPTARRPEKRRGENTSPPNPPPGGFAGGPETIRPPTVGEVIDAWNEVAAPAGACPAVAADITVYAHREFGACQLDPVFCRRWLDGIHAVAWSPNHTGGGSNGWKATILWYFKPRNYGEMIQRADSGPPKAASPPPNFVTADDLARRSRINADPLT